MRYIQLSLCWVRVLRQAFSSFDKRSSPLTCIYIFLLPIIVSLRRFIQVQCIHNTFLTSDKEINSELKLSGDTSIRVGVNKLL